MYHNFKPEPDVEYSCSHRYAQVSSKRLFHSSATKGKKPILHFSSKTKTTDRPSNSTLKTQA